MISEKDRNRLRELAKEIIEIGSSPKMANLKKEWTDHNMLRGQRPMVQIELGTFSNDVLPDLMQCEGEEARGIEWRMLEPLAAHKLFGDDTVIKDYFGVSQHTWIIPFGLDVQAEHASDNGLGYHYKEYVHDLEKDIDVLGKSKFGFVKETSKNAMEFYSDLFDGIMPVRLDGNSQVFGATQCLIRLMSMETMFVAMYDYPELFEKVMNNLLNDYMEFYDLIERENALVPTVGCGWLGQGTICLNDELADEAVAKTRPLATKDSWLYMDSQESVGLSPTMFDELVWPVYEKIANRFGLVSYGCCEPVSDFWESVKRLKNLRKVSISAWCDEDFMGEQLRDPQRKTIFHRKPSPNFLGVGHNLDEEATRQHIAKTVQSARGCALEFTQRDVYTVDKNIPKVARFVEIIREESEKHQR